MISFGYQTGPIDPYLQYIIPFLSLPGNNEIDRSGMIHSFIIFRKRAPRNER
jgi:hypothetical protein